MVSFIGFAPADDPQIAIYVVVDRPNPDKQDDAESATRIVRSVLTEVLPYMDIFMTEPLSEARARRNWKNRRSPIKQQLMTSVSGNDVSGNDISGNDAGEETAHAGGRGKWRRRPGKIREETRIIRTSPQIRQY